MKKIVVLLVVFFLTVISVILFLRPNEIPQSLTSQLKEKYTQKHIPSVDHSKFPVLQKNFTNAKEVTKECITCHTERHKEVMQSSHWNWQREEYVKGRGIIHIGKHNAINNFCIGVEGNEQSCAKCHIGFGITSDMKTLTDSTNIDCLVCHDNSETYAKGAEMAGAPDPGVNLSVVARSVSKPKRSNCGVCHFFGGGGNNVKHGDLEKSMFEPSKDIDVHMAVEGANLSCVDCHTAENHQMKGKVYSLSSMNRDRSSCEQCHTEAPHESAILNEHTLKVACQTCHIPTYAKANATKMEWDWSTAGQLKDGKPFEEDDKDGNHTYMSIKGTFKWGTNLKPEYIWFNGTADHYLLGDTISDTSKALRMNILNGSYSDPDSKIIPVKIHRAKQPFDPVTKMLIQPKLFADSKGEGAFWKDFDWARASKVGMDEVGLPFSGEYTFIQTEMTWPINHMVASKEQTVDCVECHTRNGSRLAGLNDFYMPARDHSPVISFAGRWLIALSLIGVFVHGAVRIYSSAKRKKGASK